jgi:uncharacterized protein YbjT (DUF2867 family)
MRIFLTGANGFIGGAVASALIADGHRVRGPVRDKAKAGAVATHGIDAAIGCSTIQLCSRPKPGRPKVYVESGEKALGEVARAVAKRP